MAKVTVDELSKSMGIPVERLLKHMQEAGLSHTKGDQFVFDAEKQNLLNFLKNNNKELIASPKKITLQRKTTTTVNPPKSSRKTVNVEARKKTNL